MNPREPLYQVNREPLKFRGEVLLREFDRTLQLFTDPGLLLLEQIGTQGQEVRRRLEYWIRDFQIE